MKIFTSNSKYKFYFFLYFFFMLFAAPMIFSQNPEEGEAVDSLVFLNTSIYYGSDSYKQTTTVGSDENSSSKMILNLTSGVVWRYGLLGIKYLSLSESGKDKTDAVSSLGIAFGGRYRFFQFSYSILAIQPPERNVKISDVEYNYIGDSGSVIDLSFLFGYKFVKFGPQFSIINLSYKGLKGNQSVKTYNTTNIYPFLSLSFEFPY